MRYLFKPLNILIDSCFAWFTPGWRRRGHEAKNALKRYYNYNKPDLSEEKKEQISGIVKELKEALLTWRKADVISLTEKAKSIGEGLRGFNRPVALELVESFFVIMVVFLGIRTYYFQPFRIPTGSMQPTLNGIIVEPISPSEIPSAPKRWLDAITHGSEYVNITIDRDKSIKDIYTEQKFLILTRTVIVFDDGSKVSVPCAQGALMEYFTQQGIWTGQGFTPLKAGDTLICARMNAGDMVIVIRMAYHFRKPERGETFVFDTRDIPTDSTKDMQDQTKASHYIKRLCGLPGDKLSIQSPHLLVNDKPAEESTIQRVAACKFPYNDKGYNLMSQPIKPDTMGQSWFETRDILKYYEARMDEYNKMYLCETKPTVTLDANKDNPNLREYAALGDNTVNSKDSRYWGPVRQYNVLGPAVLTIWPFTSHWGSIE